MSQISPAMTREALEATPRKAFTRGEQYEAMRRQKGACALCPKDISYMTPFHLDHVLPLELGGQTCLSNLQLLCLDCHKAKTREDIKRIRKAARLRRDSDPTTRRKSPYRLRSRGFQKSDPLK